MTPFWPVAPQTVTATGNGKSNGKISENVRSFTKWSSAKTQVTRLPITSHHITSKQSPNPELQSAAESNQKPTCFPNASAPSTCPSNVLSTYHFPELLISSPGAKILHLNYLPYNKVAFAHTAYRKQNWISHTDICTLKQQLIDSNLCQRQWNMRGEKNLWNAWVDTLIHAASSFPYRIYLVQIFGWPSLTTHLMGRKL